MRVAIRFLVTLTAACAGCAAAPPQSYPASNEARLALYAEATPCCDDPSGFPFIALPPRGYADRVIDRDSPVFEFQSGLSPFAAFELPKADTPYRVRVKSLFDRQGGKEGVFYPVLALLDDAFIVTHMTGLEGARLEPALATAGGEAGLAVTIAIDPRNQRGRYLVVFTPAALLGAPPDNRREGDLLTPSALAWTERRGEAALPASPYGRLRITIAPDVTVADIPRQE
ncbi:MAG: MalM family protein [Gammaproteobacteria bacterium]